MDKQNHGARAWDCCGAVIAWWSFPAAVCPARIWPGASTTALLPRPFFSLSRTMYDDAWYSTFVPDLQQRTRSSAQSTSHRRRESLLQQPNVGRV